MSNRVLAITTCRVSTPEQEENGSLGRQAEEVKAAAAKLNAVIPDDGQWSGNVSSKSGRNVERKDLKEMMEYCRRNKNVKYLIVHEPDRFMRSVKEAFYFEVEFEKLGVKLWYASDDELNSDNMNSKLMKFHNYFIAEGSNLERQKKSIDGQSDAIAKGRYPFHPKPGYTKGLVAGIHQQHSIKGLALKRVLQDMVAGRKDPTQALISLNNSEFMSDGQAHYKMDKFRKIATDEYYYGVVEIDKQIKRRNEKGLHEPLITYEEHKILKNIFDSKKKTQKGPNKNGNPLFPMSNLITCDKCIDGRTPRYVGYEHGNGINKNLVYEKYRCRANISCILTREEMHAQVERVFLDNPMSEQGVKKVTAALETVWKKEEAYNQDEINRIKSKIKLINKKINEQVDKLGLNDFVSIEKELVQSIEKKKEEIRKLEEDIDELSVQSELDKEDFMKFAYDFIENTGKHFLNTELVSKEDRKKCKEIIFPAGFRMSRDKKVYTPEISPLYSLVTAKKDAEASDFSTMVRVKRL